MFIAVEIRGLSLFGSLIVSSSFSQRLAVCSLALHGSLQRREVLQAAAVPTAAGKIVGRVRQEGQLAQRAPAEALGRGGHLQQAPAAAGAGRGEWVERHDSHFKVSCKVGRWVGRHGKQSIALHPPEVFYLQRLGLLLHAAAAAADHAGPLGLLLRQLAGGLVRQKRRRLTAAAAAVDDDACLLQRSDTCPQDFVSAEASGCPS